MNPVKIIIPVNDYGNVERYYRDTLQFRLEGDLFFLPMRTRNVALKLLIVDAESQEKNPPRRHFPIFNFSIANNFLSYCNKLYLQGAMIEAVITHPGGYYARVSDPEGNQFEIECESFDEVNQTIDPFIWPFYKRY